MLLGIMHAAPPLLKSPLITLTSSKNIWPKISIAYFTKWFQYTARVGQTTLDRLTCTCGSNYIGQTRRNLITGINKHKFDQRSEVCKHLLANPKHLFNFKQPEMLGSIVGQKELHLLESLLIQQYQPDLNIDGSSILLLLFNTQWPIWRNRVRMP